MQVKLEFRQFQENESPEWEDFNRRCEHSSFLTSADWIDFQRTVGKEVAQFFIYLVREKGPEQLIGLCSIEHFRLKVARFAYSPYNPVIDWTLLQQASGETQPEPSTELVRTVFQHIAEWQRAYLRKNKLTLFRIDPLLPVNFRAALVQAGYRRSLAVAQARDILVLDIQPAEEQLLMKLSKSKRYYVRKAAKDGVNIVRTTTPAEVRAFSNLMEDTTARQGFVSHSADYFLRQWEQLQPQGMTEIFLANYQGEYTAGALINFYKDTAHYAHGGSTSRPELARLNSPYLLLWEAIRYAKQKGCRFFNFWGVVPAEATTHAQYGLSLFKRGFGGQEYNYVGPLEVTAQPLLYSVHRLYDWYVFKKDRY